MLARYHRCHSWLTGALMMALTVPLYAQQGSGDEEAIAAPRERSTPESIQFAPVDEEQLGETSIQGALGPPSAGLPRIPYPGFQNRTYEPGSSTNTRVRE